MYATEFKPLNELRQGSMQKKGELKIKVEPTMLLKTSIEKMSVLGYATMFMITKNLDLICHDVNESKDTY
jgi:hypothetical protein